LYEVNVEGTELKEIITLVDEAGGRYKSPPKSHPDEVTHTSSVGEYVVFSWISYTDSVSESKIWIVKRDGTDLKEITDGCCPDFSPFGNEIIYEKPDEGIWMINATGTGDRVIQSDPSAHAPSWGTDTLHIVYTKGYELGDFEIWIMDTSGTIQQKITEEGYYYPPDEGEDYYPPDWAPVDTNALAYTTWGGYYGKVVYLSDFSKRQIWPQSGVYSSSLWIKWSPDGSKFLGCGSYGVFIMSTDGSNFKYLVD